MAVTGAFMSVDIVGDKAARRRSFDSGVRRNTIRAGHVLALVGPLHQIVDLAHRSSLTGLSSHRL